VPLFKAPASTRCGAIIAYLARYTHRVAISNSRLIKANATSVTFRVKNYRVEGPARYTAMTLATSEFIRRFPHPRPAAGLPPHPPHFGVNALKYQDNVGGSKVAPEAYPYRTRNSLACSDKTYRPTSARRQQPERRQPCETMITTDETNGRRIGPSASPKRKIGIRRAGASANSAPTTGERGGHDPAKQCRS
jgi:hypothetical protein